jgi:uncharacterized protein YjbJ (UPF0337 family)
MNRGGIAGRWRQLKGLARQCWGKATGNDASVGAGKPQAKEKQLAEWLESQHKNDPIHK